MTEIVREGFFLSCLFGSEPHARSLRRYHDFLSCLFGSERNKEPLPESE